MSCSELTLLKRALEVLKDERVPQLAIAAAVINDIQKYLDKCSEKDSGTSPCCHAPIIRYRSFGKKVCADCMQDFDWPLKPGQEPLIKATR